MINGVTVCINYADYFKHTIKHNKKLFDRWMIVTTDKDLATIQLCKDNELEYICSQRIYEDGPNSFCKGKAINEGLDALRSDDWVAHIDADCFIPDWLGFDLRNNLGVLNSDYLYGVLGRYLINHTSDLENLQDHFVTMDDLDNVSGLCGYFQMWHSSMRDKYFETYHTAGMDDVLMRDSYHTSMWRYFKIFVVHLGPIYTNHEGRVSEQFI